MYAEPPEAVALIVKLPPTQSGVVAVTVTVGWADTE